MTPSNFNTHPWKSKLSYEAEIVANNIMAILARTGNTWRRLTWAEYRTERDKDGGFSIQERHYFEQAVQYTVSAAAAGSFCYAWSMVKNTVKA